MGSPLTVFLTTYNTGLQGSRAQEQDLSSWLIPQLHKAAAEAATPDIYAIAVQELLPLHLAMAGLSRPVLIALTERIEALLSAHATSTSPGKVKERYTLVSRECRVGTALWVFARESTTAGRIGKVLRTSVGLWRLGMGNKAAVGVRMPIKRGKDGGWEVLTFISAHLEAHDHNIKARNEQYNTILSSLVFRGGDPLYRLQPFQPHHTSHLFLMGDLNYRLERLPGHYPRETGDLVQLERERATLASLDTLKREQAAGRAFGGMREGDLTRFAPTYKRVVGQVEGYSEKRIPGWTDRILIASYSDPPSLYAPDAVPGIAPDYTTQILQFTSSPEITISDHKPVHALVVLPPVAHNALNPIRAPMLAPPPPPSRPRPIPRTEEDLFFWWIVGSILDRAVGLPWSILVLLGFGNQKAGMGVSAFLAMFWGVWWSGLVGGYFSS
ncbi:DNase I-like protein [Cutaneotrichosporon oleaginosum]|uniref:DNase I-like protein n=1 Tax=Cutaneotrichosporon oleaginosum TaxID=879819 RepID=A0A0J1B518_9TREE|nr:DNase I-like protein [Cutaneotrichosporon oleaginosum]KLT42789.1 DNase I-like protein [Cutaneotrichosporon oleaginosum]TXT08243.1 hypothetical protein COLE_05167 [Cutaneotrichosporon oleaginosum]